MTESSYYSDRVHGARARIESELTLPAWGGLVSLVHSRMASNLFAEDFPVLCYDGPWPIGCDDRSFRFALLAEVAELDWPLRPDEPPDTLDALDMVQFLYEHASEPRNAVRHPHFGHYHLEFNRARGQRQLRDRVNRIFARNGMVYELDADGCVQRLGTPVVEDQIRRGLPPTGNDKLDDLLERAVEKYTDPDPDVRREAVEHLWDAFERGKTVLHADKKRGATALIDAATNSGAEQDLLREEMVALTDVGNSYRIRHHETTTIELTDELVDYLFARMFALLHHLHGGDSLA